jgi:hypothetical protein
MYPCVTTQVDSSLTDLYTGSWCPSHVELCHFKVSVLVPLMWGHQMLSCFGFSTYPHSSHMSFPLAMWPKSNNIAVFALDLKSFWCISPFISIECPSLSHLINVSLKSTLIPLAYTSSPFSMPVVLRFGLLMELVSSCIFLFIGLELSD